MLSFANSSIETVLDNEIKVYGDASTIKQILNLVAEYSSIGESQGFVQICPEWWMKILLKPGWEAKVSSIKPRGYPLGNNI